MALTAEQKYQYIEKKYGKDAPKILRTYGAKAYDIDKNLSKAAERAGGKNFKYYFEKNYEKEFRRGDKLIGADILIKAGVFSNRNAALVAINHSADTYNKYATNKEKAKEDARKIKYIKNKYGKNADIILRTYGTKAYDIDKNFDTYYRKAVFFGRNYWMNQQQRYQRSEEGDRNKKLFMEGKLPLDEAARIINCPAYFGTMQSTITRIKKEITQSATQYRASEDKNKAKKPQNQAISNAKEKQKQEPQKQQEDPKKKNKALKVSLKNQKRLVKPHEENLDSATIVGQTKANRLITESLRADMEKFNTKIEKLRTEPIKIKSPEEQKYDELIAKKIANMPDNIKGKAEIEVGLSIDDLIKLGVDAKDFAKIIKDVKNKEGEEVALKLIPKEGFGNPKTVVCKELAIEALKNVQARNRLKELKTIKTRT